MELQHRDFDLLSVYVDDHIEVCRLLRVAFPKIKMGGNFLDESLFFGRFHCSCFSFLLTASLLTFKTNILFYFQFLPSDYQKVLENSQKALEIWKTIITVWK